MSRKIFIVLLPVLIGIFLVSCTNKDDIQQNQALSQINEYTMTSEETERRNAETLENNVQELKNKVQELESKLELVKRERLEFRNDIEQIIGILKKSGAEYINFDSNNSIHNLHKPLIEEYLENYSLMVNNNKDVFQEIKPILYFISVTPSENLLMNKQEDVYYYSVTFYSTMVISSKNDENDSLRSPFDGVNLSWIIQIDENEGKWRVKEFGPDN